MTKPVAADILFNRGLTPLFSIHEKNKEGGTGLTKNVLELLEHSAQRFPEKTAFVEEKETISYASFLGLCQSAGTGLLALEAYGRPVAVYMDKGIACLAAMLGVAYSGSFYTVIDTHMPAARIQNIFSTLAPAAVLTDAAHAQAAAEFLGNARLVLFEEIAQTPCNREALALIRSRMIDTDPLYALFTSGSTGIPKGTVVCHRSVIDYAHWVTQTFHITQDTVFASQTPFYFSMSVLDIFATLGSGATLCMPPKSYFSFPVQLLEYMEAQKVNTIYWVPSALGLIARMKALDYVKPSALSTILFAGEVMPVKWLNIWRSHYPQALFANLYGPTEVTDICAYYIVDRPFREDELLPIGRACDNCGLLVLDENGCEPAPGELGELCVRGSFLAMGYYGVLDKTAESFVQNPLNCSYPELIYKTGDLVYYNERGEMVYMGRKDFQIKHMGYRIELGEIEAAVSACEGLEVCVCLYDAKRDKLILLYEGAAAQADILPFAKEKLPSYMMPNKIIRVRKMPYNANGKLDRKWLGEHYRELEGS